MNKYNNIMHNQQIAVQIGMFRFFNIFLKISMNLHNDLINFVFLNFHIKIKQIIANPTPLASYFQLPITSATYFHFFHF